MNIDERMEANAIIERMTESDGEHFSLEDAERLIFLIPLDRKPSPFTFRFSRTKKSGSTEGYAAGVGNVSVPDGKEERSDTVIGGQKVWKVGGYEVEHLPGRMIIRKMWSRLGPFDAEQEARLYYRRKPYVLETLRPRSIGIPNLLEIGFATWETWKTAR